jgi:EAL domain-containing protein (putative c-di-GMP-specific phosphodiesterase class I)
MSESPQQRGLACGGCRGGEGLGFAIRAAFHPIIDLEAERVFAYEALVRGDAGEGATEVIARVGPAQMYSFDQACRVMAIRDAVAAGIIETGAGLSINFMPNAVYSPKACIQLTLATARSSGFPADRLIFEFTENEKIETAHLQNIIAAYRALGFSTAIDDFGAGYAGLALLADLPTDLVKLDMALIREIDTDPRRRAITETVVKLIRSLGADVIAEGVETMGELAAVRLLGVRFVQGFLFGEPALGRLDPFPEWLRDQSSGVPDVAAE